MAKVLVLILALAACQVCLAVDHSTEHQEAELASNVDDSLEYPRIAPKAGRAEHFLATQKPLQGDHKFGAARLWLNWKTEHDRKYETNRQELGRFEHFTKNYLYVQQWNEKFRNGEVAYDIALNHLADMTEAEVKLTLNGFKASKALEHRQKFAGSLKAFEKVADAKLPDEVDWRQINAVTKVKDQGHCGCCWACSTTGTLESHYFLKTKNQVVLSEQNLIDCSRSYGNNGCEGGLMDSAFDYIEENGIMLEKDYPFEGRDAKCRFKKEKALNAKITSYVDIPSGDEAALAEAVAKNGPIAVAIDASHRSFHLYTQGVYEEPHCGNDTHALDHAVLLVGYGVDAKSQKPYWLVKNSWSESWGEKGYIRMARNKGNMCGISSMASYPILEITAAAEKPVDLAVEHLHMRL